MRTRSRNTITAATPGGFVTINATNLSSGDWWPNLPVDGGNAPKVPPGQTVPIYNSGYIYPYWSGSKSTITDETATNRAYHDVNHEKREWLTSSGDKRTTTYTGIFPNRFGLPAVNGKIEVIFDVSAAYWLEQKMNSVNGLNSLFGINSVMEAQARGQMKWGSIEPFIDLPRSIAELKDFKDIFKSVSKSLARLDAYLFKGDLTLSEFLQGTYVYLKKRSGTLRAELPKGPGPWIDAGISADLTYKFAVAPLIADVTRVMQLSQKAEELVMKLSRPHLLTTKGKVRVSTSLAEVVNPSNGRHTAYIAHGGTHTCVAWALLQTSPVATSAQDALSAMAGLRTTWRTAWELIPLSFVVDWFVGIGEQLSYMDSLPPLSVPFTIVSSGYSHKKEYTGSGYVALLPSAATQLGVPAISTPAGIARSSNVVYSRVARSITPSEISLPPPIKFSLPNLGQIATLIELIKIMLLKSGRDQPTSNNKNATA